MSQLKVKTRQMVEEGVARRRTWKAQGKPLEIYEWWSKHTKHPRAKEGLCHYFWVVVLFAPLLMLRLQFAKLVTHKPVWISLIVLAVGLLAWGSFFSGFILGLAIVLLSVAYFFVGIFVGSEVFDYLTKDDYEADDSVPKWVRVAGLVVFSPVVLLVFVGYWIDLFLGAYIRQAWSSVKRALSWMVYARPIRGRDELWFSPLYMMIFVTLTTVSLLLFGDGWWVMPFVLVAVPVAWAGLKFVLLHVGESIEKQRAIRDDAIELALQQRCMTEIEPVLRAIFERLHPSKASNDQAYLSWRARYVAHFDTSLYDNTARRVVRDGHYWNLPHFYDWHWRMQLDIEQCIHELTWSRRAATAKVSAPPRKDSLLKKALVITGDFLVFIAQRLRVLKWKFCPIMEFPSK